MNPSSFPPKSTTDDLFENIFKAVFNRVDFRSKAEQVRKELNKWAEDHTNGLIKDLLPPGSVSSLTDSVYGNPLYFKGAWEVPFAKSNTMDREFHRISGTSVIPYRQGGVDNNPTFPYRQGRVNTSRSFPYLQEVDAANNSFSYRQGLVGDATSPSFPFGQGGYSTNVSFSMYFYLPDKNDGLDDLVKAMASSSRFLDYHVPRFKVLVKEFRIPKFKIAYGLDGKDLGLSSMALYHKACVEIDEEGAEAAAATFAAPKPGCLGYMEPPKRIDFVADHPFVFLIREDTTGTVLFVGQIFDPSDKSF
ncbi:Serpin-Z1 [Raphanus sativus]|nr:Serpin-Z1 [Raphanus sativus]